MKTAKRLSIAIAIILILPLILTVLSACNDRDTFDCYYFSDERGEFVRRSRVQMTVSKERDYLHIKEDSHSNVSEAIEVDGRKVFVGDELKYYASEYFIASVDAMKGQAIVDDSFNGKLMIGSFSYYDLTDGVIYTESGEKVGEYSVRNNYVTIALNGTRREYMFMRLVESDGETRTVGLFDEFYAMISVLADTVDNTGVTLNKTVLLANSDDEIIPTPRTRGYSFNEVSYEVVEADGYDIEIDENGKYDLKVISKTPSDNIKIKITADGLTKIYDFMPIAVAYDKSLMVMRFTGDSIDFGNTFWYLYANVEPKSVQIKTYVVHGEENCEQSGNVLTFTDSGVVVVKMVATINIDNAVYVLTDEASINISERYVE